MEIKYIYLNDIDLTDEKFKFSYGRDIVSLITSIKKSGIFSPLQVIHNKKSGLYTIFDGWLRISAINAIGVTSLPVLVLNEDAKNCDIVKLVKSKISGNRYACEYNNGEKAIIISKLTNEFQLSSEEIIREYLPLIGLQPSKVMFDTYLKISKLPDPVIEDLTSGKISIQAAKLLCNFSNNEIIFLEKLINEFQLGINFQIEFLRLLKEICRKDLKNLLNLFSDSSLENIVKSKELENTLRRKNLFKVLRKIRYPKLNELEEKVSILMKMLRLPPEIELEIPTYFEGDEFYLHLKFSSTDELNKLLTICNKISRMSELNELLSFL